jgi:hypothetical protein
MDERPCQKLGPREFWFFWILKEILKYQEFESSDKIATGKSLLRTARVFPAARCAFLSGTAKMGESLFLRRKEPGFFGFVKVEIVGDLRPFSVSASDFRHVLENDWKSSKCATRVKMKKRDA